MHRDDLDAAHLRFVAAYEEDWLERAYAGNDRQHEVRSVVKAMARAMAGLPGVVSTEVGTQRQALITVVVRGVGVPRQGQLVHWVVMAVRWWRRRPPDGRGMAPPTVRVRRAEDAATLLLEDSS